MKNKNLEILLHTTLIFLPPIYLAFFLYKRINYQGLAAAYITNLILLLPLLLKDWKEKKYTGYWIAIITLFYSLPWIVLGIDLTDESYNLLASWFYGKIDSLVTSKAPVAFWLSHLWLKLIGAPFFLWERISVNIILAITLFISYKTLSTYFDNLTLKWSTYIFLFTTFGLLSYNWFRFLVPYDRLSMLLSILFFYLWFTGLKHNNYIKLFLAGLFIILGMYSRITNFFILPLIPLSSVLTSKVKKKQFHLFIIGLLSGIIILVFANIHLIDFLTKNLNTLLSHNTNTFSFCTLIDPSHTPKQLILLYFREIKIILLYCIIASILFYLARIILQKSPNKPLISYLITVFFSIIYVIIIIILYISRSDEQWFYISAGIYLSFILLLIPYEITYIKENLDFFLSLLIIVIISFIGTNSGLRKIHINFATAFVVPIILGLGIKNLPKSILLPSLFFFATLGLYLNVIYTYRDYSILQINSHFSEGITRGLWTKNTKLKEIKDFYKDIHNILKNKEFLTTHHTFFFALINEKIPVELCWSVDPHNFNKALTRKKVKYIIFSNFSMRAYNWDKKKKIAANYDLKRIKDLKNILDSLGKPIIYSPHKIFVLYKLKAKETKNQTD